MILFIKCTDITCPLLDTKEALRMLANFVMFYC